MKNKAQNVRRQFALQRRRNAKTNTKVAGFYRTSIFITKASLAQPKQAEKAVETKNVIKFILKMVSFFVFLC